MKLLIVEDEERIARALKKGLEEERFAVDVTHNGKEGFDMASAEEYDVIILDRMLPGMDGLHICTKLRSAHNTTPILMLTALGQVQDKVQGLTCGADDYMTKPFAFDELLARIRSLTRRPKSLIHPVLRCHDLTLNTDTYVVSRNKTPIQLSGKEFAVLSYLMRNINNIITKQQIIDHVWDFEADILPNTVEVTIRNIRNKIERPFSQKPKIIQTVRGFGYQINE